MSQLLDREVISHHALVVDANPTSRSVLLQNLRSFGFQSVKQASRIIDARDMLEHRRYDVVICDYHFDNGDESGQDLLEELRREQMLPYSTVFVMVTAEATYAKVAEAAESALDSYLVKPFSASTLFERVKEARQRKRVLKDIFEAMEARDFELAAPTATARRPRTLQACGAATGPLAAWCCGAEPAPLEQFALAGHGRRRPEAAQVQRGALTVQAQRRTGLVEALAQQLCPHALACHA